MNNVSTTKLHHKLVAVTAERDALAAELQKLREQKPVVQYMARRLTPEATTEMWGYVLVDGLQPGAMLYAAPIPALAVLAPPTPFIPDDDTRRNDEAFAAQQAATAPAVPEEWRKALQEAHDTFQRYADLHRAKDTRDGHEKANANQKLANKLYAMLQSAEVKSD